MGSSECWDQSVPREFVQPVSVVSSAPYLRLPCMLILRDPALPDCIA